MHTALPTGTLNERLSAVKATRVYLRQSKEQDKQRESVPTQRAACERLAHSVGISPAQWSRRIEYIDIDRAGDDATREELGRLLRDTQADDTVLAFKEDRVGRDMIDSAAAIRELVKYRRCTLYTVETGTIPVLLDSAEQTAMVMFRGMIAQGELERVRSRTRDGLRQRARDGFATNAVSFGYRTTLVDPSVSDRKKSKKRIEIDETAAPIVRRIFAMYLDGRGHSAIAKALNREGAPSPRGRGWGAATVWRMLRAPHYAGHRSHGERRVKGRVGKKVLRERAPESEVVRTHRPELAIIPPDEWARVQAAMAARNRDLPSPAAVASSWATVHPLSGLLKCGECGGPMRVKTSHNQRGWKRRYYVCGNRQRTARCSNSTHVPADDLEQRFTHYLCESVLCQIEATIRDAIRGEVHRVVETSDARASEAEQIRAEIETLRRERLRLVRLAAATDDPVPEVVDALSVNNGTAKTLQEALAVATRPPIDLALAERLEVAAVGQVQRMRDKLTAGELRETITVLFPAGLRFIVGNGLWQIQGAASVPTIANPDAGSRDGSQARWCCLEKMRTSAEVAPRNPNPSRQLTSFPCRGPDHALTSVAA
jgi:site-specific DNA recombinase